MTTNDAQPNDQTLADEPTVTLTMFQAGLLKLVIQSLHKRAYATPADERFWTVQANNILSAAVSEAEAGGR